jgi:hypothetical protein
MLKEPPEPDYLAEDLRAEGYTVAVALRIGSPRWVRHWPALERSVWPNRRASSSRRSSRRP